MKINWLNEAMTEAVVTRGDGYAVVEWGRLREDPNLDGWRFFVTKRRVSWWIRFRLNRARADEQRRQQRQQKRRWGAETEGSPWVALHRIPTARVLK